MGQDISQIDSSEIQKMLHKFGKLDEDQSGALSAKEFMQIPELTSNPLVERVIDIFDSDGNGEVVVQNTFFLLNRLLIRFHRWISLNLFEVCYFYRSFLCPRLGMSSFASKGDTQHKLRFAFNIYDIGKCAFFEFNRSSTICICR